MRLLDKNREKSKQLTGGTESEASGKKPAHGFWDAVREEIGAPGEGTSSPHEVTVEDVYQDLIQRKQRGEMPRNPREALMDVMGKRPASEVYATAAVFDLSRQYRDHFLRALEASDSRKLFDLFRATFSLFLDQPETVGLTETAINKRNEDTDPTKWHVSGASLTDGSRAALCRMPIQNRLVSARLIGIVFSDSGDRYYYSMLNKDAAVPSEIMRCREDLTPEKAGIIEGTEPEPMNRFLDCIKGDRP